MKHLSFLSNFTDNGFRNTVRCKATEAYCNAIINHRSALGCRQSSIFHKGYMVYYACEDTYILEKKALFGHKNIYSRLSLISYSKNNH